MNKLILLVVILNSACNSNKDLDFIPNSPEGIILRIEKAHNNKNLDSIILNTDFETMARLAIVKEKFPLRDSILLLTTDAMLLSEIKQIKKMVLLVLIQQGHINFRTKLL